MKQLKVTPAINKAFEYVKGELDKGEWLAGERMPTAQNLAAGAQVSIATMIRAIAILKSKRLITSIERGHIRAGSGASVNLPSIKPSNATWHLKRTALEKDILNGNYSEQNRLPALKELQSRYGVGYRPLRKILSSMVNDGALHLNRRTYELKGTQTRSLRQRILFLTHNFQSKPLTALNRGQYRIFDLLEYECIRREIQLKIMEIESFNLAGRNRSLSERSNEIPETGFIVDLWWSAYEQFNDLLSKLLARLSMLKKPVAILDENGEFILPLPYASNPFFQVFKIEGVKAGSRVARFLLGMGHRSVAYISTLHHTFWSKQRFEGIVDQFTKAGCRNGVQKIVRERVEIIREHMLALSDFDESLIRRLLPGDTTRSEDEIYKLYAGFKESFSPEQFTPDDILFIKHRLNIVKELADKNVSDRDFNQLVDSIFWQIGTAINPRVQAPVFNLALASRNVTAWICANDDIALTALSFLHDTGIKVPQELSVIGFDNQPIIALEHRLTSYDFNAGGFVHRMLNFIARPPKPRGPYRHVPVEVEGIVMQRDTTAPPSRK